MIYKWGGDFTGGNFPKGRIFKEGNFLGGNILGGNFHMEELDKKSGTSKKQKRKL